MTSKDKVEEVMFNWNTARDAELEFLRFEMIQMNDETEGGYAYLDDPAMFQARYPILPGPFVSSVMPPGAIDGAYAALSQANKTIYMAEKNAYDLSLRSIKEQIKECHKHIDIAIAKIEKRFFHSCAVRKRFYQIRTEIGLLPAPPTQVDKYRQMKAYVFTFKPDKPKDIDRYLNVLKTTNCRNGEGWQVNSDNFADALHYLQGMGNLPDRLSIQKWISEVLLRGAPEMMRYPLLLYGKQNAEDLKPGAPEPAIPRWVTCINEITDIVDQFPELDYIGKMPSAETRVTTYQYTVANYCPKCGRDGHSGDVCTYSKCVCRGPLNAGHNLADAEHEQNRKNIAEFVKQRREQTNQGGRGSYDRGQGRVPWRGGREPWRGGRGGGRGGRGGQRDAAGGRSYYGPSAPPLGTMNVLPPMLKKVLKANSQRVVKAFKRSYNGEDANQMEEDHTQNKSSSNKSTRFA